MKLKDFDEIDKKASLIREKLLFTFNTEWKPLKDFLSKNEKKRLLTIIQVTKRRVICNFRDVKIYLCF